MRVTTSQSPIAQAEADVLVVPIMEGERADRGPLRDLDRALGGVLQGALEREEFKGKALESALWPASGIGASRVLLVGTGKRGELDADRARDVAGVAARRVRTSTKSVAFVLRNDAHAQAVVEGFLLGDYQPDL